MPNVSEPSLWILNSCYPFKLERMFCWEKPCSSGCCTSYWMILVGYSFRNSFLMPLLPWGAFFYLERSFFDDGGFKGCWFVLNDPFSGKTIPSLYYLGSGDSEASKLNTNCFLSLEGLRCLFFEFDLSFVEDGISFKLEGKSSSLDRLWF